MISKNKITAVATAFIFFLGVASQSFSQSLPVETIAKIYERLDTLNYLTFDVNYVYKTDTISGDYENSSLSGSFTLAGNRAFYSIGDIQFMQNDSFLIAVYPQDKIIIVSDPQTSSSFIFQSAIDSLMSSLALHYTVTTYTDSTDSTQGVISFFKADSLARYDRFLIKYDTLENYLTSIQYDFKENSLVEPEDTLQNEQIVTHQKKFIMWFSNYRISNFSDKIYDESNYIWFENGKCRPADKYKDYRVLYSRSGVKRNTNSLNPS
jgi:hypothetical protein